jgi:energy-coupling factor transporter transmembrane protein EcfT
MWIDGSILTINLLADLAIFTCIVYYLASHLPAKFLSLTKVKRILLFVGIGLGIWLGIFLVNHTTFTYFDYSTDGGYTVPPPGGPCKIYMWRFHAGPLAEEISWTWKTTPIIPTSKM